MEIKPEEKFMDILQELIADDSVEIIEVNYYNTGGCYVTAHAGEDYTKLYSYEFYKPANKSNRLSGEMSYLESHNNVEVRRSKLHARDTYEIIKNAPSVDSTEKNYFEERYVSENMNSAPVENILEVLEQELSQPQVMYVTFDSSDAKSPYMFVETGTPNGPDFYVGFRIYLDPKNYDETIRFLVRNSQFFAKKYSIEFISHLCKDIEKTPIRMYRTKDYQNTVISQKKPVSEEPVFQTFEDMFIMSTNGIQEFIERQMDNDDVELIYLEKMEETGAEKAVITLKSGAKVAFSITDGDLAKAEEYTDKNKFRIEAEGFWTLSQTQHGAGNRRMLKIRALPLLEKDAGTRDVKVISNAKRFLLNALKNRYVFRFSVFAPTDGDIWAAEILSNDLRTSYDLNLSREAFLSLIEIMESEKEELEKKYRASIFLHPNEIKIEKEYRIDYRHLIGNDTLTEEMFDFLSNAYQAGCNIAVKGKTGTGKTTFLRALYEGANDKKLTALLGNNNELLFPDSMSNFIALRGTGDSIASTALKISPARIVLDELRLRHSQVADFIGKYAKSDIQVIASMHSSIEHIAECKPGFVIPFDIEVELVQGKVVAINQMIVSGHKVERNALWKFDGNGFTQVNAPTRSLRRKIEQGLDKLAKSIDEPNDSSVNPPANPLVTISKEEKEELMQAMKTIQKFMDKF